MLVINFTCHQCTPLDLFVSTAVQNLQSCAPLWLLVQHFDCREQIPQQRLVPVEALLDLYAAKQLSRSTLVRLGRGREDSPIPRAL